MSVPWVLRIILSCICGVLKYNGGIKHRWLHFFKRYQYHLFADILDTSKFPVPHRSSIDIERFEFDLLRSFQSEWFEVAIWPRRTGGDFPEFLASDEVLFPVGSSTRKRGRTRSARLSAGRLHSDSGLYLVVLYK